MSSFTLGCPDRATVDALHDRGTAVSATITTPTEAQPAQHAGVDAFWLRATRGRRAPGVVRRPRGRAAGLLALLQLLATDLPVVASGGIATARGVAAELAADAQAAQAGSGFLLAP